jgi:hypothetical protein
LIARCHGVADVVDAVNLTRDLGLEVAVRGGGHNVAGRATIDGGVMIDLAPMKGIHVDPKSHTAQAQGGGADLAASSADRSHHFKSDPSRTSSPLHLQPSAQHRFEAGAASSAAARLCVPKTSSALIG